jgi:peptidoglycan hydrolase-like protein with peptidoglycan-binding domain
MYSVTAVVLLLASASVHPAFAQYPGEPKIPDRTYDPVREMNYDRQWGMPDETVRQAQQVLRDQGYYHGPLDGVRNTQYLKAISNFQRAKGLPATTHLDGRTLAALNVPAAGAASPRSTAPSNFGGSPDPTLLNEVEAP